MGSAPSWSRDTAVYVVGRPQQRPPQSQQPHVHHRPLSSSPPPRAPADNTPPSSSSNWASGSAAHNQRRQRSKSTSVAVVTNHGDATVRAIMARSRSTGYAIFRHATAAVQQHHQQQQHRRTAARPSIATTATTTTTTTTATLATGGTPTSVVCGGEAWPEQEDSLATETESYTPVPIRVAESTFQQARRSGCTPPPSARGRSASTAPPTGCSLDTALLTVPGEVKEWGTLEDGRVTLPGSMFADGKRVRAFHASVDIGNTSGSPTLSALDSTVGKSAVSPRVRFQNEPSSSSLSPATIDRTTPRRASAQHPSPPVSHHHRLSLR